MRTVFFFTLVICFMTSYAQATITYTTSQNSPSELLLFSGHSDHEADDAAAFELYSPLFDEAVTKNSDPYGSEFKIKNIKGDYASVGGGFAHLDLTLSNKDSVKVDSTEVTLEGPTAQTLIDILTRLGKTSDAFYTCGPQACTFKSLEMIQVKNH